VGSLHDHMINYKVTHQPLRKFCRSRSHVSRSILMSLVLRTPFCTQARVRKKPHCHGSMMTGVKQLSNREFHGSISQMRMMPCLNSRPISKEGTPWSTKKKQTVGVVLADTLFTQVTPRFIMCGSVVKVIVIWMLTTYG